MGEQGAGGQPEAATSVNKKERSPSFPFVTLSKALERAREVYTHAKRHEVRLADLASAWKYGAKSSGGIQTAAALVAFGLLEDQGSGDARKFRISDLAFKALEDQRPGERERALAEIAVKPKLIGEYAEKWKDGRPSDSICVSELRIDRGFTDEGARAFLRVFDDSMGFTKAASSGKIPDKEEDKTEPKVGDLIQWTSGDVDQFAKPATVVGISEDHRWIWIAESKTGIPMNEVRVISEAKPETEVPPQRPVMFTGGGPATGQREEKFALAEGDVVIQFPEGLSADSVDDLEAYITVFLKKARREADSKKKEAAH